MLLVGEKGERVGVVPLRQALQIARERSLDLVEVAPGSSPPVCRLLDWGKYKYEQTKKEREVRKTHKIALIRELRLRPRIKQHDLDFKIRMIQKLLSEGNKVKVSIIFRGREITHPEIGRGILQKIVSSLKGIAAVDSPLAVEERNMNLTFSPLSAKLSKEVKKAEEPPDAKNKNP